MLHISLLSMSNDLIELAVYINHVTAKVCYKLFTDFLLFLCAFTVRVHIDVIGLISLTQSNSAKKISMTAFIKTGHKDVFMEGAQME